MKNLTVMTMKLLACLMLLVIGSAANGQIMSRGDLFGPGAPPAMAGVEVGFGKHTQQGSFTSSCQCTFENGDGTGAIAGAFFELPLDYQWAIGLKAALDFKNTSSAVGVQEPSIIQYGNNGDTVTAQALSITRNSTVSTTYIDAIPYVQYQFFRMGPFVEAGISMGFLMSNKITQVRDLNQTSYQMANGVQVNNLRFQNGTLEESVDPNAPNTIQNVAGLRLGLLLSAGYHIQVSDRSVLAPLLSYDFPLTTISTTNANGWKIGSLYATVELKFRMD